jgi:hypothetical protein
VTAHDQGRRRAVEPTVFSNVERRSTRPTDRRAEPDPIAVVGHHLAVVAVDGASDEMERGLDPAFRLHLDGLHTDRHGYQALVGARWAAEGDRPPLDVVGNVALGPVVTAAIAPRGIAHFRVDAGLIAEAWITSDWNTWLDPLHADRLI